MYVLNFTHPLTDQHMFDIGIMLEQDLETLEQVVVPCSINFEVPIEAQIVALVDAVGFSASQWQADGFVLNLPALSMAAAAVLAEIHGRCGYWPPVVLMRRAEGGPPIRFEAYAILNLGDLRDAARTRRSQ